LVYDQLGKPVPTLPITDLCEDAVVLPVAGVAEQPPRQESPIRPAWQRWNDYGIGCLLEGGGGSKRGNLRQAETAFRTLLTLGEADAVAHAHINLARVMLEDVADGRGDRLNEAARELAAAQRADPPAPWWTLAWFNGLVTVENATSAADLDSAVAQFEKIVDPANQPRQRNFDFTRDAVVLIRLGDTLFRRSQYEADNPTEQRKFLLRAASVYERALAVDPEDVAAHLGLNRCYARLGQDAPDSAAEEPTPVTAQRLLALGSVAVDGQQPSEQRLRAAAQLGRALEALGRQPADPKAPKLPPLRALEGQLRRAFESEKDDGVRTALAAALGHLHRELYTIYRPDDLAAARPTEIYRSKHPAANAAAEAIVIYPTRRPGAPGFDR
jgi:hypothetical protein